MSETSVFPSSFICSHAADRSLLVQGFTLPGAMLVDFSRGFVRWRWESHERSLFDWMMLHILFVLGIEISPRREILAYPNGLVEPLKVNVHL